MNLDKKVGLIFLCVIISIVLVYYFYRYYRLYKAAKKANQQNVSSLWSSTQNDYNISSKNRNNMDVFNEYFVSPETDGGKRKRKPKIRKRSR